MTESRELRRLTSLRWFAALAVFLNHFGNKMIWTAQIIPTLGFAGVDLFFVLSGVVLTWSAPIEDTAARFCLRRFARIYPAAMAAGLIAVLLAFALGRSIHAGLTSAVAFVLLIQAWWPGRMWASYNGVEWTLSCEAFFDALFPWLRRSVARIPQRQLIGDRRRLRARDASRRGCRARHDRIARSGAANVGVRGRSDGRHGSEAWLGAPNIVVGGRTGVRGARSRRVDNTGALACSAPGCGAPAGGLSRR